MESQNAANKKLIASIAVIVVIAVIAISAGMLGRKDDKTVNDAVSTTDTTQTTSQPTTQAAADPNATYKDGTYSADGEYQTPGGTEDIGVKLTVKDGTVTESELELEANNPQSQEYQQDFKDGYKQYVVGKKIGDIQVSQVSGSSLTSGGFNEALQKILSQAKA